MANEGIMALPQGMDMPAEEAQTQQPIAVSSADSYDAAQTALGMVDPGGQEASKQAVREAIGDLQLTQEEIDTLLEVVEYLSQNPGEYSQVLQQLIQEGIVEQGDLPDQYDPEFMGMLLVVLNEMQSMRGQGAMEPMQMSPTVEGLAPIGMAEGGLADVASYLASQGRNGDSMLAHITPEEAELLRSRGGSGTINPVTGLPEFFIKKAFKAIGNAFKSVAKVVKSVMKSPVGRILGTIALATVLGPAGMGLSLGSTAAASAAINAGIAGAGATLLGGGSLKEALISGAMGYIGGGGTIMGTNPLTAVGKYMPGLAGSALNTGLSTGIIGAGIGKLGGMSTQDALRMGLMSGATAGAMQGARNTGLLADGNVSKEDIRQGALENFRRSEITAQNAAPTGAPGPIGTAADIMSPVEVTGTAQAARFMPFEGGPSTPQGAAFEAAQRGDIGRVAELQQKFPDQITGKYTYDMGGGARSFSMPTDQPMSKLVNLPPLESGPTGGGGGAPAEPGGSFSPRGPFYNTSSAGPDAFSPLQLPPGAPSEPGMTVAGSEPGFLERMTTGAKNLYGEYLSPDRPGLPADAGLLRKYGPLMGAGLAATAAFGGMKGEPANQNPVFNRDYTGDDYIRDNPSKFSGGLDLGYVPPSPPRNPIVETPSYASIPIGRPGVVMPGGITQSPGGVAQPYNVSGLYGVPLLYGPDGRPQRLAKGGQPQPTYFPRKNGPINGPGTGTSDDIPAMLSDGEFVFTAKAVRNAGGGSRRKGAARMYKLMKKLEGGPV